MSNENQNLNLEITNLKGQIDLIKGLILEANTEIAEKVWNRIVEVFEKVIASHPPCG